jgi:hypothetical protein
MIIDYEEILFEYLVSEKDGNLEDTLLISKI